MSYEDPNKCVEGNGKERFLTIFTGVRAGSTVSE